MTVASNDTRRVSIVNDEVVGGVDTNNIQLPSDRSRRVLYKTTDGSLHTAWSEVLPNSLALYIVVADVCANRSDISTQDQAYFSLRAMMLQTGGGIVVIGTPEVLAGQPTDSNHNNTGATTWTAVFNSTGSSAIIQVKGQSSKTINWSILVRYMEAF